MERKNIVGLLLIVHGLITSTFMFYIENPPEPAVGWDGTSWLLTGVLDSTIVQMIGYLFWGMSALLFVMAGIAVFMKKIQWRMIDILASIVSLSAYILFWFGIAPEPMYYILGPVISIITLTALVIVRWPPDEWIFGYE